MVAIANVTTGASPFEIASRLSILTRRLDRLTFSPARHSRGYIPAVEHRIVSIERTVESLEMDVMSARPSTAGDVVAQLVQVTCKINVVIDSWPATIHEEVNRNLHRAVEIIAMEAGVNLRDVGGDEYLVDRYLRAGGQ